LDEGGTNGAGTITSESQGYAVFISGSFGTLTLGDTDGSLDWALAETGMGSAIADDHTSHAGYYDNEGMDDYSDNQILRYDYSFGDFAFAVSMEQADDGAPYNPDRNVYGLGAKFNTDLGGASIGVGLGYQKDHKDNFAGVSVSASVAGFDVVANYSEASYDSNNIGIGIGYTIDAVSVSANYGERTNVSGTSTGFGATVNYDLGGGAVIQAGFGSEDNYNFGKNSSYSLGLALSF
jgi:outer membrane protein OmpU